jgi:hypothetical protein
MADVKEVFKAKVNERLSLHPNQWAGEASAEVVKALVSNLKDDKGNPVVLTDGDKDVIDLISRPTAKIQMRVIKRIVEGHTASIDAETDNRIQQVVNAAAFKLDLIKAGKITGSGDGLRDLLD